MVKILERYQRAREGYVVVLLNNRNEYGWKTAIYHRTLNLYTSYISAKILVTTYRNILKQPPLLERF